MSFVAASPAACVRPARSCLRPPAPSFLPAGVLPASCRRLTCILPGLRAYSHPDTPVPFCPFCPLHSRNTAVSSSCTPAYPDPADTLHRLALPCLGLSMLLPLKLANIQSPTPTLPCTFTLGFAKTTPTGPSMFKRHHESVASPCALVPGPRFPPPLAPQPGSKAYLLLHLIVGPRTSRLNLAALAGLAGQPRHMSPLFHLR
jgi:hypothetical protein